MDLQAIQKHIDKRIEQKRLFKDSYEFMTLIHKICHKYKVDLVTLSDVGRGMFGNKLLTFDKDGFFDEKEFCIKGITKEESTNKLISVVNKKYVNERDFILINQGFWGMRYCQIYDSKTHKSIRLEGDAGDIQNQFRELEDIYHEM